jgi:uncharacterized protein
MSAQPVVRCFLLKVASRCNINCDYCYMYNHLDQGWMTQPKLMSANTLHATAERIREYATAQQLDRIAVVYHGGEPLLLGTAKLVAHASCLRQLLPGVTVEFSLQTNGVLLTEADVIAFEQADIQVSLSLDGPQAAHDRHRLDHRGQSSYAATEQALTLLERYPAVFAGVIAVIDARNSPADLLHFFGSRAIPQLDFLLPDANYLTLPIGRAEQNDLYTNWLLEAFDLWFDKYPTLKIRTFDGILASVLGVPSETDGLGFGDVSLITIETDGSYHDLDVLKITGTGTSLAQGSVHTTTIAEALHSEQVARHRLLLRPEGLSEQCRACPVVEVCGGGAVAHRYSADGYSNPSIYCQELRQLIEHASRRAAEQLQDELAHYQPTLPVLSAPIIEQFEATTGASNAFLTVLAAFEETQIRYLQRALQHLPTELAYSAATALQTLTPTQLQRLAIQPALVAWTDVMLKQQAGIVVHAIDGRPIEPVPHYVQEVIMQSSSPAVSSEWPLVHRSDPWLRAPFGDKIYFETPQVAEQAQTTLTQALHYIQAWKPALLEEMRLISPEIQYIRDLSAHPDKVVSFSDNSVPGALYVQVQRAAGLIDACDLADSLIHEHRHQKLYLLQRVCPIVEVDYPLVASPWREELRPPTGLFHALYVFVELLDFWTFLAGKRPELYTKASSECRRISEQLRTGFGVVESCALTTGGRQLLDLLRARYKTLRA